MTMHAHSSIGILTVILLAASCTTVDQKKEKLPFTKEASLFITHPGFTSKEPETHSLSIQTDADGNPVTYRMDVRSVFCSDEKCEVIRLDMQWDPIGRYKAYGIPPGESLTKYDHEPFEQKDYTKFDQLMTHRTSVLGTAQKKHLLVRKASKTTDKKRLAKKPSTKPIKKAVARKGDVYEQVDGISGATAAFIKDVVVEGAAYTCFTMWHWANGDTANQIRAYTQTHCADAWLIDLLRSEDHEEVEFALETLTQRQVSTPASQTAAVDSAKVCTDHGFSTLVTYLEQATNSDDTRYAAYSTLLYTSSSRRQSHILERLLGQRQSPPLEFFQDVSKYLTKLNTFYDLQLILALADKHDIQSHELNTSVASILQHDNFFMARRAHTFLKQRSLKNDITNDVLQFEQKHKDQLTL